MKVEVWSATNVGKREKNEDAVGFAGDFTVVTNSRGAAALGTSGERPVVAAVADGAGGHPAGDRASVLALNVILSRFEECVDAESVRTIIVAANRALHDAMLRVPEWRGMATTLAGVAVTQDALIIFNVGDSTVFAVDLKGLLPLSTSDKPPAGAAPAAVVTQMLGGFDPAVPIQPHVSRYPLTEDERLLLCSDGVTDSLLAEEIARRVNSTIDDQSLIELVDVAAGAGADNASAVLMRLSPGPTHPPSSPVSRRAREPSALWRQG